MFHNTSNTQEDAVFGVKQLIMTQRKDIKDTMAFITYPTFICLVSGDGGRLIKALEQ